MIWGGGRTWLKNVLITSGVTAPPTVAVLNTMMPESLVLLNQPMEASAMDVSNWDAQPKQQSLCSTTVSDKQKGEEGRKGKFSSVPSNKDQLHIKEVKISRYCGKRDVKVK